MGASTWVPLVTAAAGLIAGLAAGLIGTVLARRWSREDRAEQWQREDALRWHQDRLQVYTRTIAALEAWGTELRQTFDRRIEAAAAGGGPPPFDAAEWERHDKVVSELLALVQLMAPEQVLDAARGCYIRFFMLGRNPLATEDPTGMLEWDTKTAQAIRRLVEAMRADLGLGGGQPRPGGGPGHAAAPG